jgi:NAD(P)-dependent dehydrogenase (short-subunit alcohol dehydrogenase family)
MDAYEAADVITDFEWDRVMTTNLTVPTRMIRAVLPFMKAKKNGSIINVASKAATSGAAAGVAYTTSKHGLVSISIWERRKRKRLMKVAWCDKTYGVAIQG